MAPAVYNDVDVNTSSVVGAGAVDAQLAKARELADRGRCVRQEDGTWVVASLNSNKKYRVNLNAMDPNTGGKTRRTCTCPAFEVSQSVCKHISACISVVRQETLERTKGIPQRQTDVETPPIKHARPTYSQPSWAKYNAGQCAEKDHVQALLADLTRTLPEPARKPGKGRKPIPIQTAIFSAVYKVYLGWSARRGTCDLEECCRRGHIDRAPHFNSVLNTLEDEATTPILYELVRLSALPLREIESTFAVDSSGFCTNTYTRWYDVKYGRPQSEVNWVKLHASVGCKTNVICATLVLDKNAGDGPQLPALIADTAKGFNVGEVVADAAYTGNRNLEAIASVGAAPYIAFRTNTTAGVGGLFAKAFHFFCLHKEEFLARYHQRSNVESAFSALKRKLGEAVKAKGEVAQRNEVLAKVVAYNLTCLVAAFHELGIAAEFTPKADELEEEPAILRMVKPG